ncbi:hypothetical protein [Nakamurella lactea]|uniref:hypothetical protein n=1 Tax=Nakamurella lactea TaxID=459515 RepID=UPI0004041D28|nr:hypothetical protein [Nakamurella lactea]
MSECECFPVENPWTYYGIVEPGGAMDPNPDCPVHFPANEKGPTLRERYLRATLTTRSAVVKMYGKWWYGCDFNHRPGLVDEQFPTHAEALAAANQHALKHVMQDYRPCCWCSRCQDVEIQRELAAGRFPARFMIVCPDCGNKRCPRATFHEHTCTGSNDPGQEGSRY